MKKILVFALAFIAVAGAFAQAPALSFGLYGDITASLGAKDSYGIYTETYLTYKNKDMGLSATVVAGADLFATPRNYAFWYTWCNGLKISAGKLRETGNARLTNYINGLGFSTRMANSKEGVMAYWSAVPNLTMAWFLPVSAVAPMIDFRASSAGISYAIPNVVTLVSAYRSPNNSDPAIKNEFSFGVDIKSIKETTLKFGIANSGGFWSFSNFFGPTTVLYGTFGKSVGDLNYGLDFNYQFAVSAVYGIRGMVEYTMGSYVLGAQLTNDNGDPWYGNEAFIINPYIKKNFAAGDIIVGITYDVNNAAFSLPVDFEISF